MGGASAALLTYLVDHISQRVHSLREHGGRASVEVGQQLEHHDSKVAAMNE